MSALTGRRRAGLLIPLFSCPSTASWGIGDIGDVEPVTAWLASAGQRVLQLLPLNEMAPGQQSPYSAISAMAIDPIFIRVPDVPEFEALGGEAALSPAIARRSPRSAARRASTTRRSARLKHARAARRVRALSRSASGGATRPRARAARLSSASRRGGSRTTPVSRDSRARGRAAVDRVAGRAAAPRAGGDRSRAPRARRRGAVPSVPAVAGRHAVAGARAQRTHGVELFGDLPFMVDGDSADVWARQQQFRLDVSVGAPPDAFSATGQDWGMPLYRLGRRWRRRLPLAARARAPQRRSVRRLPRRSPRRLLPHLRPAEATAASRFFTPADEPAQLALGERVLGSVRERRRGDHRRGSRHRSRLRARVARAPRRSRLPRVPLGAPLAHAGAAVPRSVRVSAASRSRRRARTTPSRWSSGGSRRRDDERRKVSALPHDPAARRRRRSRRRAVTTPTVRDVLLEALFASGSDLLLLPIQDVFGWRDRINEPATVTDDNWTYRLPWPVRSARSSSRRRAREEISCAPGLRIRTA